MKQLLLILIFAFSFGNLYSESFPVSLTQSKTIGKLRLLNNQISFIDNNNKIATNLNMNKEKLDNLNRYFSDIISEILIYKGIKISSINLENIKITLKEGRLNFTFFDKFKNNSYLIITNQPQILSEIEEIFVNLTNNKNHNNDDQYPGDPVVYYHTANYTDSEVEETFIGQTEIQNSFYYEWMIVTNYYAITCLYGDHASGWSELLKQTRELARTDVDWRYEPVGKEYTIVLKLN